MREERSGLATALRRAAAGAIRRADHAIGRSGGRRRVLFETRSPLNLAVLRPVIDGLRSRPGVDVRITHRGRADIVAALETEGLSQHAVPAADAAWMRFDLYVNADPWAPVPLHRTRRRVSFFHGVAGKYNLDCPAREAALFDAYDRVGFANADRMTRYLEGGVVTDGQAVLVGYPKLDALVRGAFDGAAVRRTLGLEVTRPTAIYAPTWSPVSSLHVAGEAIIQGLISAGWNVIAKLHDNCFLLDEKYAAGIDWRARLAHFRDSGRFALVDAADSSPYLAASDVMVTDHSSIGFEFLTLDRPLVVFDAPDLVRVARINPEKVALLRSAAVVARTAPEVATAATAALADPRRLGEERRRVAGEMFYRPGTATDRALALACQLLDLPQPEPALEEPRVASGPHAVCSQNV